MEIEDEIRFCLLTIFIVVVMSFIRHKAMSPIFKLQLAFEAAMMLSHNFDPWSKFEN